MSASNGQERRVEGIIETPKGNRRVLFRVNGGPPLMENSEPDFDPTTGRFQEVPPWVETDTTTMDNAVRRLKDMTGPERYVPK